MQGTCGAPLAVLQVISGAVLLRSEVLGLVTSQMDMRLPPPHISPALPLHFVLQSRSSFLCWNQLDELCGLYCAQQRAEESKRTTTPPRAHHTYAQ